MTALMPRDCPFLASIVERPDASWDSALTAFSDANLMQTAAYGAARWGSGRLVGLHLRDARNGRILSASLAVVAKTPLLPAGIAAVKFGPVWRRSAAASDPEILDATLAALKQEFSEKRSLLLRVMPPPDPEGSAPLVSRLEAMGFKLRARSGDRDRYFVFLKLRDEDMLASLSAGWRRHLRKAEAQDLDVVEISGSEALVTFNQLYTDMIVRKRFADTHAVQALEGLLRPGAEGARVLVARHGDKPVAITVLAGRGDIVSVPFSATSDRALELRAGYLLRWRAMRLMREADASWLDLGGDEGDEGLRSFKAGNVGKSGRIVPLAGDFDFCLNPVSRLAARAAEIGRRLASAPQLRRPVRAELRSA